MSLGFMPHYDASIYDKEEFVEIWSEIAEIGIEVSDVILRELKDSNTVLIPGSNSETITYLKGCLFILGFSEVDKGTDVASYDGYTSDAILKTKTVMNEMGISIEVIDKVDREFIVKLKELFETSDVNRVEFLWKSLKTNKNRPVQSKEISDVAGKTAKQQEPKLGSGSSEIKGPTATSSVRKGDDVVPGFNFPKNPSLARMSVQYSLEKDGSKNLSPNFKVKQFASKDKSDVVLINPNLISLLDKIQEHFGKKVNITSGYRTPNHNRTIKGAAQNSQHMYGNAADITIDGVTPQEIHGWLNSWHKGGLGLYKTFVHVDVRNLLGEDEFTRWGLKPKDGKNLA